MGEAKRRTQLGLTAAQGTDYRAAQALRPEPQVALREDGQPVALNRIYGFDGKQMVTNRAERRAVRAKFGRCSCSTSTGKHFAGSEKQRKQPCAKYRVPAPASEAA